MGEQSRVSPAGAWRVPLAAASRAGHRAPEFASTASIAARRRTIERGEDHGAVRGPLRPAELRNVEPGLCGFLGQALFLIRIRLNRAEAEDGVLTRCALGRFSDRHSASRRNFRRAGSSTCSARVKQSAARIQASRMTRFCFIAPIAAPGSSVGNCAARSAANFFSPRQRSAIRLCQFRHLHIVPYLFSCEI